MIAVCKFAFDERPVIIVNHGNGVRPISAGGGNIVGGAAGSAVSLTIRHGDEIIPAGGGFGIKALENDSNRNGYIVIYGAGAAGNVIPPTAGGGKACPAVGELFVSGGNGAGFV